MNSLNESPFDTGLDEELNLNGAVNNDLKWGLSHINEKDSARGFLKTLEGGLCIHSNIVSQLYSKYKFEHATGYKDTIIVLPDPYAFEDNFSHINTSSLQKTNAYLIPGESIGKRGVFLLMLKRGQKPKTIPFWSGMNKLLKTKINDTDYFLPVIVKGDLREINSNVPSIRLSTLCISKLDNISPLNALCIKNTIKENIFKLCKKTRLSELKSSYLSK
jgi:hypothetical protein